MTTTADAMLTNLLAAICANPSDDAARLIYADRCEEIGQEVRAEFIRVQIKLKTVTSQNCGGYYCDVDASTGLPIHRNGVPGFVPEVSPCPWKKLRQRETELFSRHGTDWLADFFGKWAGISAKMQRGFVERITTSCADWLAYGRDIVRQMPVTRVELTDWLVGRRYCWSPTRSNFDEFVAEHYEKDYYDADMQRALNWARTTGTPVMPRLEDVK